LGVELLITDSPERAQALAEYIHQLNCSRDSLERSTYLAAHKQIKDRFDPDHDPAFVLAGAGWHPGVIGIVAGRLAEKYHRPVVLISIDQVGRSRDRFRPQRLRVNLHQALDYCSDHLLAHGGHAAAAGLRIDETHVDAFRAAFCEFVACHVTPEERIAQVDVDAEAPLSQLTLQTVEQIEQLAPFGAGNPRPVLCANGVRLAEPPRLLGGGDRHLALKVTQHEITLRALGFGHGEWLEELSATDRPIDIVYRPVINHYGGRRSVELHLVDWRVLPRPALARDESGGE